MKRKSRILLLTSFLGVATSAAITTLVHKQSTNSPKFKFEINGILKPNFETKDVDLTNAKNSATDFNLPKLEKPKVIISTPDKKIVPIEIKPIIEKEKPKVDKDATVLNREEPKKDTKELPKETKPLEIPKEKPKEVPKETPLVARPGYKLVPINNHGIIIYAEVKDIPPREYSSADIARGIANRVPYRAELLPEVSRIIGGDTEENIKKTVDRAILKTKWADGIFRNEGALYNTIINSNDDISLKQEYFDNDGTAANTLGSFYWRYHNLIWNKELMRKYVDDVGLKHFDEWWNSEVYISWPHGWNRPKLSIGKFKLLMHLDYSKFDKISDKTREMLRNGHVLPEDTGAPWINSKGEWEIDTTSPPIKNGLGEIRRNNREKRVLGNDSIWSRSGDDILKGKYHNWTKLEENFSFKKNPNYAKFLNLGGFEINRYVIDKKLEGVDRQEARIITIDAGRSETFKKTLEFIEFIKKDGLKVDGYRILNVGKSGYNQNFDEIFAALPDKLPMLELFFESKNTTALKYLKNKEIDELSLITNNKVNSLADDWALNPWALNKVAWVNMADYNVSSSYNPWDTIYTRITFDNLAFDDEDIINGDLTNINNGLRMAYWTRNNERIFQGGWGPGTKPDRESDGNSYPMGLDFSNAKKIKTLKGMIFYNEDNPSQKRKLNKIKLYNDSDTWTVSASEMNGAQFADVLVTSQPQMPKSKITFSNGKATKKIKITPDSNSNSLDGNGLRNLSTLMSYSDGTFNKSSTEVIVSENATNLYNSLKGAGFQVKYSSTDDDFEIF
ncbi:membrane protein [Mycoplasmopsis canis]|uniref:putative immunoglobulin-blocking virulence protein n=1 Tax=Mycoplasmopsis canis TaxID=29555 RepID=UPI00062458CB|nr:putative immunoglobulin-blocking virulence protein [Mycoplasmopsis canis]AKF41435.1 membrane protein [Mycoplasmopsis canis]